MAETAIPATQREFRCVHCNGKILIPRNLPPTTGPCPHCSGTITSPALETEAPPPEALPAPVKMAPQPPLPPEEIRSAPVVLPSISVEVPVSAPPPVHVPVPVPVAAVEPVSVPTPQALPPAAVMPPVEPSPPPPEIIPPPVEIAPPPPVESHLAAATTSSSPVPRAVLPEELPPVTEARKAVIPAPREKATPPPPPQELVAPTTDKTELPAKADHSDLNKPKKSQSGKKPAKEKKQRSGLIPAMLVLLVLILLGGGIVIFASKQLGRTQQPPNVGTVPRVTAVDETNYVRVGWQKDALQLLRNYVAATTVQEKIPYILNGPQLASKMEDFYGGGIINDNDTLPESFSVFDLSEEDRKRGLFMMNYDQPPQFDMREFFQPLASLEVQYGVDEAGLLLSTLANLDNFAMEPLRVFAIFKRTPEGLKLDWEVFAQTKYRTLQNFVELPEPGHSGVFRVFIVEDVPDKGKAVAGTRTYRVADPANAKTDTARINVKVDSETGRALSLINWRNTKENRPITKTATIELKWVGEANAPELEISRFICWEFLGLGGQESSSTASTK